MVGHQLKAATPCTRLRDLSPPFLVEWLNGRGFTGHAQIGPPELLVELRRNLYNAGKEDMNIWYTKQIHRHWCAVRVGIHGVLAQWAVGARTPRVASARASSALTAVAQDVGRHFLAAGSDSYHAYLPCVGAMETK